MKKKMKTLLRRLRNKRVLVAIASGITLLLTNIGIIDLHLAHKIDLCVDAVLFILMNLGIVSDPESHIKE